MACLISNKKILDGIIETLSDESRWCKFREAENKHGNNCAPRNPSAYYFSVTGLAAHLIDNPRIDFMQLNLYWQIREEAHVEHCQSLIDWNDRVRLPHEKMMEVLHRVKEKYYAEHNNEKTPNFGSEISR